MKRTRKNLSFKPRFYTDAELYYLPIEFTFEEYTADKLGEIWGVSRSFAWEIADHSSWINQRAESEGEGLPLLTDKRIQQIRDYQWSHIDSVA